MINDELDHIHPLAFIIYNFDEHGLANRHRRGRLRPQPGTAGDDRRRVPLARRSGRSGFVAGPVPGRAKQRLAGDERLLVNDSKEVFSAAHGLAELEVGVLAALRAIQEPAPGAHTGPSLTLPARTCDTLGHLLQQLCPDHVDELQREVWFHGGTSLPLATTDGRIDCGASRLLEASRTQELHWGPIRAVVVCPNRFNDLVDRWDSKAAVLALGLVELMRSNSPRMKRKRCTSSLTSTVAAIVTARSCRRRSGRVWPWRWKKEPSAAFMKSGG